MNKNWQSRRLSCLSTVIIAVVIVIFQTALVTKHENTACSTSASSLVLETVTCLLQPTSTIRKMGLSPSLHRTTSRLRYLPMMRQKEPRLRMLFHRWLEELVSCFHSAHEVHSIACAQTPSASSRQEVLVTLWKTCCFAVERLLFYVCSMNCCQPCHMLCRATENLYYDLS